MKHTIIWRGIDMPGHEYCSVYHEAEHWSLSGVAVFTHDGQPCRLEYLIKCSSDWKTLAVRVSGWIGDKAIDVEIITSPDRRWFLNGTETPAVKGCIDVDLNFSPATNLLPIRRLNLRAGEQANVSAAWLRFPSFELERLEQVYRRLDESTYRYESNSGAFIATLTVNEFGLVTKYPELWEEETR